MIHCLCDVSSVATCTLVTIHVYEHYCKGVVGSDNWKLKIIFNSMFIRVVRKRW